MKPQKRYQAVYSPKHDRTFKVEILYWKGNRSNIGGTLLINAHGEQRKLFSDDKRSTPLQERAFSFVVPFGNSFRTTGFLEDRVTMLNYIKSMEAYRSRFISKVPSVNMSAHHSEQYVQCLSDFAKLKSCDIIQISFVESFKTERGEKSSVSLNAFLRRIWVDAYSVHDYYSNFLLSLCRPIVGADHSNHVAGETTGLFASSSSILTTDNFKSMAGRQKPVFDNEDIEILARMNKRDYF